jgi:NAD(P)H-hydrate repair Nnr-like enzyme with NAD(P)H-hydrate epimerase domain
VQLFLAAGGREIAPKDLSTTRPLVIADCLLGYSVSGAPRAPISDMIKW